MDLTMTQVKPSQVKGMKAHGSTPFVLPAMVLSTSIQTLKSGDAVILVGGTGAGLLIVDKAAITDKPFGFVLYNTQKNSYVKNDMVTIACATSTLVAQASGAVQANDDLEFVPTGTFLKNATGSYPICGKALTDATDAGLFLFAVTGQLAATAAIVGGAINAATIGASTPSTGAFTTLSASGTVAFAGKATAKVVGSLAATALTPGATPAIDATLGKIFTVTPAQHEAFTTTGGVIGQEIVLIVLTSGASPYNLSFNTGFGANAGTLATGTADAKKFAVRFIHDGTSFVEIGRTAAM